MIDLLISSGGPNLQKLVKGRFDLAAHSIEGIALLQRQGVDIPFEDIEKVYTFMELPLYMVFNNQTSNELIIKVNAAFEELKSEDYLEMVHEKYGLTNE